MDSFGGLVEEILSADGFFQESDGAMFQRVVVTFRSIIVLHRFAMRVVISLGWFLSFETSQNGIEQK